MFVLLKLILPLLLLTFVLSCAGDGADAPITMFVTGPDGVTHAVPLGPPVGEATGEAIRGGQGTGGGFGAPDAGRAASDAGGVAAEDAPSAPDAAAPLVDAAVQDTGPSPQDSGPAPQDTSPVDTGGPGPDAGGPGPDTAAPDTGPPPPPPPECVKAAECPDDDPCTEDLCIDEACVHHPKPGCCVKNAQCDDGSPCTADTCVGNFCEHALQPGCCVSDAQCDDGLPCTADFCIDGGCQSALIPGCCEPLLKSEFTDGGALATWDLYKPNTEISWQVWSKRFVSPPASLYMGNPLLANYINFNDLNPSQHLPSAAAITTAPIAVPAGASSASVSFQLWMDIEDCIGQSVAFDLFQVSALGAGGNGVNLLGKCQVPWPWDQWHLITLDLTGFKGQSVSLRFGFDSVDADYNSGEGIYIDDVEVKFCY